MAKMMKVDTSTTPPLQEAEAVLDDHGLLNPGTPFNAHWVEDIHINSSAVERRVDSLKNRRSLKKEWQAAWLLRAISCIDLTTLAGDDTPGRVKRLCNKARNPVRQDI